MSQRPLRSVAPLGFVAHLPLSANPRSSLARTTRPAHTRLVACQARVSAEARENLASWLKRADGCKVHPSLDLSDMAVRGPVAKGAALLEFPQGAVLCSAQAEALFGARAQGLSPAAALAAVLLEQRDARASPEFAALFGALPRAAQLHHAFLWDDAELALLRGSALRDKALRVRDGVREEWGEVCAALGREYPLHDYMWAQALVSSRALDLGRGFALSVVPGLEFAAYAAAGAPPSAAAIGESGGFFSKPKVSVCTTRELGGGEAVSLRFAEEDAGLADYVLDHGFVPEGKAARTLVELAFGLAKLDPFVEDKRDIIEQCGLETSVSFVFSSEETRGVWSPPESLDAYLRLVCLAARDAFLLEGVFRGEVWGFMEMPVSESNERGLCDAVIAACEDALDAYPAFPENTEGLVAERVEIARRVVTSERAVLERARDYYQRELGSLSAKEYYQERRLKALDLLRPVDESEIVDAEAGARMGQAFDERY